jgi:hypothetical protein
MSVERPSRNDPAMASKYRNKRVRYQGILFDSMREADRYAKLSMLLSAGKIKNLERQVSYVLAPSTTIKGKTKRALVYRADFRYIEDGNTIVEDVKGAITDVYIIKRHLMKTVHNIDIREV